MNATLVPHVKKIAVLRPTALGDMIFALPALNALHTAYPAAEIVYLGRDWHAAYLPGRLPGAARVLAVPPPRGAHIAMGLVIDPEQEAPFLRQMQAEHFDIALQMQGGGGHSNPFIQAFYPRVSAGARAPDAPPLDRWIPYTYYQHEVIRNLDVVALVGAHLSTERLTPHLPVLASDLAAAAPLLEGLRGPFAVLHPGSTDPRRCWSPLKFAAVADFLHEQHHLHIVLTGVTYENERLNEVQRHMRSPSINLCSQLSLPALTGVLSRAALVVSNDTGPLHLALAVGTRAVGLFWSEYVVNSLPLARASFLPLISWERICPRCGQPIHKTELDDPDFPGCAHEVSFLESILPEQVMAAAGQLCA